MPRQPVNRKRYVFPEGFFDPPEVRPEWWPDDPDLRRCVDWMKGRMAPDDWDRRRHAAAERLYRATVNDLPEGDRGRLFDPADTMGFYVFTAEAALDHIQNYDLTWGSRIIPVFQALGRDLETLLDVVGVEARLDDLLAGDRNAPNGGLFEMLVALAYQKRGVQVSFIPRQQGRARSPDLLVQNEGRQFCVECKRMETSDYGEAERQRMRELWGPLASVFAGFRRNIYADLHFKVAVADIPDDYLRTKALAYRNEGEADLTWDDPISSGELRALDLAPVRAVLQTDMIVAGSSRLMQLLTAQYIRNGAYSTILGFTPSDNPRYIDDIDLAVVMRWETSAPTAIQAKARDIQRKLHDANNQLYDNMPGVVHIGWEAVDGDAVEAARNDRIFDTARRFDPQGKPLEYVYCHYLVPEAPPDKPWAYDETTQWLPIRPQELRPIEDLFLVTPPDGEMRVGPHWQ